MTSIFDNFLSLLVFHLIIQELELLQNLWLSVGKITSESSTSYIISRLDDPGPDIHPLMLPTSPNWGFVQNYSGSSL